MALFACLLAGGSGTRFWPASTAQVPKQFLPLTGGAPMIRECFERLRPLAPAERICVVTSAATRDAVREILSELPPENVLGEPAGRNTAAACALAAHWASRRDPDAVLVTTPSDYLASPPEALRDALAAAARRAASAGTLLTLGLQPTYAATGYGWIKVGPRANALPATPAGARADGDAADPAIHPPIHMVERFVEKPDRARAERFLQTGGHLWNLGMFAWQARAFLEALAAHAPGTAAPLAAACGTRADGGAPGTDEEAALAAAYAVLPSISVDHAVLEKAARVEVVPCAFLWDDLGSFAAVGRHLPLDERDNCSVGPLLAVDAHNNIAYAEDGRMTALLGVSDLVVVHAHGVTLVAPRSRAEDVRRLVEALGPAGLERFR